jgi:hypothetical protein
MFSFGLRHYEVNYTEAIRKTSSVSTDKENFPEELFLCGGCHAAKTVPKIFFKKYLLLFPVSCIIILAVTLIAMKREVAACHTRVFRGANVKLGNWRQVTVQYSFCYKADKP